MWPYWFLFLPTAYWALSHWPQNGSGFSNSRAVSSERWPDLWRLVFVALVLMIGLRHEVGGDWFIYISHVNASVDQSVLQALKQKDPAYGVLNLLAVQTGLGVYLVNIISACIFSWGLLSFCRAQTRPWLSLVVAVPYMITVVAMGYTRQGAAIGLSMMAMVALSRGSVLRFVFWVAVASVFHKSAVILVPLAILASSRKRLQTLLWVSVAGVTLFALLLQESLDFLIYGYIDSKYQSSGAGIRIAMNALPAVFFLALRRRFRLPQAQRSFWTWMAWVALLFVVLLAISPSSTAVDRVALYWIPLQLFVLSRVPDVLGSAKRKNTVWVACVVLYSAGVLFTWLTYADTAFAWLPYQFYPWVWLWQ
jgi:hypothetical protein